MSNILNLLSFDGFISVNKVLIRKLGLEEACVVGFLATMHEYHASKNSDGWFFVKYDIADDDEDLDEYRRNTVKHQLGLKEKKFLKITNDLLEKGIICMKKKGIPMRKFYKLNDDVIRQLLIDEGAVKSVNKGTRSSSPKRRRLVGQNGQDCSSETAKIYTKEKITKRENISSLKDLIKKEVKRREDFEKLDKGFKVDEFYQWLQDQGDNLKTTWKVALSAWLKRPENFNKQEVIKQHSAEKRSINLLANKIAIIKGSFEFSNPEITGFNITEIDFKSLKLDRGAYFYHYNDNFPIKKYRSLLESLEINLKKS